MKMSEKLQEIKKDNKGFSLVELIIVIAIMAILIGIVGMNVIPQINNARRATDGQVLSAMVSEAMEVYTQVAQATGSYDITITCSSGSLTAVNVAAATDVPDGGTAGNATVAGNMKSAFEDLADISTRVLKSNDGKDLTSIVIHCADGTKAKGVYIGTVDDTTGEYTPLDGFEGYEFRSR